MSPLKPTELFQLFDDPANLFRLRSDVLAPLRTDKENVAYAALGARGYKIYRLPTMELALFESFQVPASQLSYPSRTIDREELPPLTSTLAKPTESNIGVGSIAFSSSQFGVYMFVQGDDSYLLHMLEFAETKCAATLLSWEEQQHFFGGQTYRARLKFSPFARKDAIVAQLTDYALRSAAHSISTPGNIATEVVGNDDYAVADDVQEESRSRRAPPEDEPAARLPEEAVATLEKSTRKKRVSAAEKCLRNSMLYGFPGLAIHPESVGVIIDRFPSSDALFAVLRNLSDGKAVKMKAIMGGGKKSGWREVVEHIKTGVDTRGRVYVRAHPSSGESSVDQFLDVLVTWKQNQKGQEKTMRRLHSMSAFGSRDVVLG